MDYSEKWEGVVQIVLDEKNSQHFINTLDKTKTKYLDEIVKKENELVLIEKWNVPDILSFGESYIEEDKKNSVMKPFYVKYLSESERTFTDLLDKSDKVEWWFKNGDRDATFFAVPYDDNKIPFYVDFIVKFKNGKIGLFDPHSAHLADFGSKSDGLQKYIKDQNKKDKELFGGIVANTDDRNYKGRWIYFTENSGKFKKGEFENWMDLEF